MTSDQDNHLKIQELHICPYFKNKTEDNFDFSAILKKFVDATSTQFKKHCGFDLDSEKFHYNLSSEISEDCLLELFKAHSEIEAQRFYLFAAYVYESEEGYTFNIALGLFKEELAKMKEFWKRILQIRGVLAENNQLSF